ncbi:MCP four helix bundle domain-containing protein [Bacillus sp. JJ1764]|uniref:MCP four helix bundle domain-containing protein n=1 Tax=Bacillus sp. JJ1764 TaxID=3122964 RepID=UPI0030008F82
MNFFKNFKFAQKISVLTASFFLFLAIIGYVSFNQITNLHSNVKELNDSRLVPIVQLEDLKSNIEYIKTQSTSIMDARDDAEEMSATQKDVATREATVKKQLTAYKNNSEYIAMVKKVNAFLTASE